MKGFDDFLLNQAMFRAPLCNVKGTTSEIPFNHRVREAIHPIILIPPEFRCSVSQDSARVGMGAPPSLSNVINMDTCG